MPKGGQCLYHGLGYHLQTHPQDVREMLLQEAHKHWDNKIAPWDDGYELEQFISQSNGKALSMGPWPRASGKNDSPYTTEAITDYHFREGGEQRYLLYSSDNGKTTSNTTMCSVTKSRDSHTRTRRTKIKHKNNKKERTTGRPDPTHWIPKGYRS